MRIINDGLPELIYKFLTKDSYDHSKAKNTITATQLLKPTQEYVLSQRYKDKIVVQASKLLWRVFGSAIHSVLETDVDSEERLYHTFDDTIISGKFDKIYKNEITDYKCTSALTVAYGSRIKEWRDQLSIYKYLYWKNKFIELSDVGKIIAIFRDWSDYDLTRKRKDGSLVFPKYPKSPMLEIPIKLLTLDETEKFISNKLSDIKKEMNKKDSDLNECSNEDCWYSEKKDAYNKCEKYCDVKNFCMQYKKRNTEGGIK